MGHIFAQGNMVLISVFFLLVCMSIVSWNIIFRKIVLLKRERKYLIDFRTQYLKNPNTLISSLTLKHFGCVNDIIAELNNISETLNNSTTLEKKEIASVHLVQVLDKVKIHLDSGLTTLASIASSAPFIGLFGTVWGIYGALLDISAKGSAGLSVVAAPMGEALVATAVGLFAAIPAVLAYNTFVRINRLIIQDLRHICEQFSVYLPSMYVHK
jgi:biopolymer transport protein ExbB